MQSDKLLKTQTINYQDLIGNGKSYRVPPYQRDYSWTEEQWEDLWGDIIDLERGSEQHHYLGALVVETQNGVEFNIIDGQQRFATLSLLALAVIDRLQKLADDGIDQDANRERAERLRGRFVGEKDPAALIEISRLHLNENDERLYQDFLVQLRKPLIQYRLRGSHKQLWNCFQYFQGKLASWSDDGHKVASLISETMARKLFFILITVEDELSAYTVFETLNARGLELTTTDLVKNYLFAGIRFGPEREVLQRSWKALTDTVDPADFPEFLRYHLLCEEPEIRARQLFKLVKERTPTPEKVFALIKALEERVELFAALSDPMNDYWAETNITNAREHIRELCLFQTSQATHLLFAAREMFGDADFIRVLKIVSVISFRYQVIGKRNTNELEPVYHQAARAVLDGDDTTPAAVFERLQSIYVSDEAFQGDFQLLSLNTRGQGKSLARYILARLEEDVSGREYSPDTDRSTIEHVFPENPESGDWEDFPPKHRDDFVSRLGNLTLLEAPVNRKLGNADYAKKLDAYAKSEYGLTRQIARDAPESWTPDQVNLRQKRLAKRAVHLWRVDFA